MDIEEFIAKFADLFDDTDPSEISASTAFHDLEEWSSLTGMATLAMAKTQYGKIVSGAELRSCTTVEDLFNLVKNK